MRVCRVHLRLVPTVFFFQAEDGIRDKLVTGVQTCALPISRVAGGRCPPTPPPGRRGRPCGGSAPAPRPWPRAARGSEEIGRAAGRGRGEISVGAVSLKKKNQEEIRRECTSVRRRSRERQKW